MSPDQIKHCKAPECRARIVWVRTQRGARLPLDAEPVNLGQSLDDERGLYYIDEQGTAYVWTSAILHDVGSVRRSHWLTCLDPKRFSGASRRG